MGPQAKFAHSNNLFYSIDQIQKFNQEHNVFIMKDILLLLEKEKDLDMLRLLSRLTDNVCGLCRGQGHDAKDCATKKKIDKSAKYFGVGESWGKVKNKFLVDGMQGRRIARISLAKNNIEEVSKTYQAKLGNGRLRERLDEMAHDREREERNARRSARMTSPPQNTR